MRAFPPVYSPVSASSLGDAMLAALSAGTSDTGPEPEGAAAGPRARVEQLLLGHYPGRKPVWTQSGTAALALALMASRRSGRGVVPRVALPAYACPDLGTAASHVGAQILLYDVHPRSLAPDLDSLRRVLNEGCTHVVVAHLYGRIIDLAPLEQLALEAGVVLIEDAAQHAGGLLRGVRAGALAPWSIMSFGRGKGLNAGGGGLLLSPRRAALDNTAASELFSNLEQPTLGNALAHVGRAAATQCLSHPLLYALARRMPGLGVGSTDYHELSHIAQPPAGMYALLRAALLREPTELAVRRANNQWYREQLQTRPDLLCDPCDDEAQQGALRFPVHLPREIEGIDALGVVRSYPRTLAEYPEILPAIMNPQMPVPGARQLAASLHTLPTHRRITPALRQRIVQQLLSA